MNSGKVYKLNILHSKEQQVQDLYFVFLLTVLVHQWSCACYGHCFLGRGSNFLQSVHLFHPVLIPVCKAVKWQQHKRINQLWTKINDESVVLYAKQLFLQDSL